LKHTGLSQGAITYIELVLDIKSVFFTSFVESIRDQSEIADTVKYVVNEKSSRFWNKAFISLGVFIQSHNQLPRYVLNFLN
jgi:hypothetical protein